MTLAARLEPFSGRPLLVAIAAMNGITGLASAVILAPLSFGADVDFLRRGAEGFLHHYPVHDFVFTPLAAIAAVPLALVSATTAAIAWTFIELALLLAGVLIQTRGREAVDRLLIAIAVLGFLPVVNELLLGQVTIVIAAGLLPAVATDGRGRGVALGVVLAFVPKPLVIPVVIWMAIRRRRALSEAVVTAAVLTLVGLIVAGPEAYGWWIDALLGAGQVTRQGNMALSALPMAAWVVGAAATVVVAGWAISRNESTGFVAALLAGLLLAPYTLLYALSILVVAVRPAITAARRSTSLLALVSNVALVPVATAWLLVSLAAMAIAAGRGPLGRTVPTE